MIASRYINNLACVFAHLKLDMMISSHIDRYKDDDDMILIIVMYNNI